MKTVLAYQEGFVAAIEAGDGLAAALHTPAWARLHLEDARLLLLYSRHDFVGDWPAALKRGVRDQAQRFEADHSGQAAALRLKSGRSRSRPGCLPTPPAPILQDNYRGANL